MNIRGLAKSTSASEDGYEVTTDDLENVKVAALLYQSQEELVTPRRYLYIDEVGLELPSQRPGVLITEQVAPVEQMLFATGE